MSRRTIEIMTETFFCFFFFCRLGMQQYALVTENLYKDGHLIGMAYRVKNDNSKDMTNEDLKHDIIKNARVIENLIGVAPKYVRLHYTKEKDIRLEKTLAELGFVTVGYNLDSQDYLKKNTTGPDSVPDIYSKTLKNFKEKYNEKGSFISIHYDGPHSSSLDSIGHIVNTIEGEGYMMVRLDGCMNDEKPYKKCKIIDYTKSGVNNTSSNSIRKQGVYF